MPTRQDAQDAVDLARRFGFDSAYPLAEKLARIERHAARRRKDAAGLIKPSKRLSEIEKAARARDGERLAALLTEGGVNAVVVLALGGYSPPAGDWQRLGRSPWFAKREAARIAEAATVASARMGPRKRGHWIRWLWVREWTLGELVRVFEEGTRQRASVWPDRVDGRYRGAVLGFAMSALRAPDDENAALGKALQRWLKERREREG